jgi:hypothetical protein
MAAVNRAEQQPEQVHICLVTNILLVSTTKLIVAWLQPFSCTKAHKMAGSMQQLHFVTVFVPRATALAVHQNPSKRQISNSKLNVMILLSLLLPSTACSICDGIAPESVVCVSPRGHLPVRPCQDAEQHYHVQHSSHNIRPISSPHPIDQPPYHPHASLQ